VLISSTSEESSSSSKFSSFNSDIKLVKKGKRISSKDYLET